jgi:hypothetical protein
MSQEKAKDEGSQLAVVAIIMKTENWKDQELSRESLSLCLPENLLNTIEITPGSGIYAMISFTATAANTPSTNTIDLGPHFHKLLKVTEQLTLKEHSLLILELPLRLNSSALLFVISTQPLVRLRQMNTSLYSDLANLGFFDLVRQRVNPLVYLLSFSFFLASLLVRLSSFVKHLTAYILGLCALDSSERLVNKPS